MEFPNNLIRTTLKNAYWSIYGKTIPRQKLPTHIDSILFICLGNICRSPFAERLARKRSVPAERYLLDSAGIRVARQNRPPEMAIHAASNFGVHLEDHRPQQLKYGLMESYDLILSMEAWQYRFLKKLFPEFQKKIFLFPMFRNKSAMGLDSYSEFNIKDPFGKESAEFYRCFERIDNCLAELFAKIKKN